MPMHFAQALLTYTLLLYVFYCLIFFFPEGPPPLPVREKDSTIPEVHSGRAVIGK